MSHFLGFDPEWAAGPKWSLSTGHSRIDDLWWLFDNVWKFTIVFSLKVINMGYGSISINTIFRGMNIHLPAILMFTRGTRFWHTAICIYIVQFLGLIRVDVSKPTCWSDLHVCWLTSDFPKLFITYFVIHCSARLKWHPHWNHHLFFSGLRWIEHFNFWLKSTCLSMLRKFQGAVWPAASYAGAKAAIERGRCREHCFWTPDRCRLRQLAGYSLVGRG